MLLVTALLLAAPLAAQAPDPPGLAQAPEAAPVEEKPFSLGAVHAQQAIVVVTDRWEAQRGQLLRYELVGQKWMQVGGSIEVVVGENGMGWGLGLHPLGVAGGRDPRKTEGDGRAPAGVFALSSAFGRGAPVVKTTMPWLESTPGLSCIDDPRSTRYNRLVDVSAEPEDGRDWRTAEVMLRDDGLYDVGVLIDHNALGDGKKQVIAGRGSCVFLHIWRKKGRGTAGCTAMARWDLEKVVEWLDPSRSPVLVQLPRDEWIKRRIPWGLP